MENKQNNSYLSSEGTGKLMLKYSLPCVISLLVGVLYNIIDRIFIANADYLGSYGSAAKSVGNSIVLSLLSGLILTAIYLAFSDGIITVFGGTVNKETYNYSKEYFFG